MKVTKLKINNDPKSVFWTNNHYQFKKHVTPWFIFFPYISVINLNPKRKQELYIWIYTNHSSETRYRRCSRDFIFRGEKDKSWALNIYRFKTKLHYLSENSSPSAEGRTIFSWASACFRLLDLNPSSSLLRSPATFGRSLRDGGAGATGTVQDIWNKINQIPERKWK